MLINKELHMMIDNTNNSGVFYDKKTNEYAANGDLLVVESKDDRIKASNVISHIFNFNSNESLIYNIVIRAKGIKLHDLINAFNKVAPSSDRTIVRHINTLLDKKVIYSSNNSFYVNPAYNIENKNVKYIIVKL